MRLFAAVVLASATLVSAQSFTSKRDLKNLSPEAIAKLHTLESLNALPPGKWRFHAGDIPHGESPTLDDSAWPLVSPHSKAPRDAVWYRREITVPQTLNGYDISGSTIWFQFDVDANGPMPEIIYFNGRRVALGDDLEPIILFQPAHPGDKILVAVKLLHTVDEKSFHSVNLKIEPGDSTNRPNPSDIATEIITAANLLPALPTPRPDLLPKVEDALNTIDFNALKAANQSAFDASLLKAQTLLSTLAPILETAKIDLDGNSHMDAAWLWPRSETIDVVRRTFTSALQLMAEYPNYVYTQSAAQYYAWMADKYPDLNNEIRQRIHEGRWEVVGGMWVEPDLNLPGGESLVRQLLVGQRFFQKEYGVTARIGWNPDSFGYNWQLPQIYKRSGLDYFVTQKMHWNDTNQLPFRLFWWESPDGSKVLTYFPTDYAWTNVNPERLSADFAESAARNPGTFEHLDLYGVGDHGGGPTRAMLDQANKWIAASHESSPEDKKLSSFAAGGGPAAPATNPPGTTTTAQGQRPGTTQPGAKPQVPTPTHQRAESPTQTAAPTPNAVPTIRYSTAQHYFDDVQTHLNPNSPTWNYDTLAKGWTPPPTDANKDIGIPTWNDELYLEFHRGVYTTQAHHKANLRRSETQTLNAEKYASLAWLDGANYPADALTESWKKITFNDFHDLAAGSGIATIYRDAQKDFTEVFHSDDLIDETAIKTIASHVDMRVNGNIPILMLNPLPWNRGAETVEVTAQVPDINSPIELLRVNAENISDELLTQVISKDPSTNTVTMLVQSPVIPSIGYKVLHLAPKGFVSNRHWGSTVEMISEGNSMIIRNPGLAIKIDTKTGCILSMSDHRDHDFLAPHSCANQLQTFADNPKQYDAWNIDPGTLDKAPTLINQLDSIKLVTDGPLRKTIRIERTYNKSHITQDISLDAYSDFIRIDTTVDWHETHTLLKAAFPLAATSDKATYEIPYGSIERPTTRNNSFEKAKFEVPALRWADLGNAQQGVSILNDSKYGYDALGNTLRLTLLRSPTWPDPDADQGLQHFTYEIYPHTGPNWKPATIRRAYELNNPLTAQQTFAHTGTLPPTHSFVSLDEPNVILTAVKKAEDTDALIFRMYEATGQTTTLHLHIPPGATSATETNLMETPFGPNLDLKDDTITTQITPYKILTLEVHYPHTTTATPLN